MTTIYVKEQGTKVGRLGERVVVSKNGQVLQEFPVGQIEQIVMMGNVQITSQASTTLAAAGIDVVKFSIHGKYQWRIVGAENKHARLRQKQLESAADPAFALQVAKAIVDGKIHNQRVLLQRQRQRLANAQREPAVAASLHLFDEALRGMLRMQRDGQTSGSIDSVRGFEGKAGAYYFQAIGALLAPEWEFRGRQYFPAPDPFNALLSFCYSLVQKDVLADVHQTGFDPYLGFFHQIDYGRPSLALDLMEEWRPTIGDALALELVNRGSLTPASFRRTGMPKRPVELGEASMSLVLRAYSQRLETRLYHADAGPGGETRLRHAMLLQARRLARVALRQTPVYEPYKSR